MNPTDQDQLLADAAGNLSAAAAELGAASRALHVLAADRDRLRDTTPEQPDRNRPQSIHDHLDDARAEARAAARTAYFSDDYRPNSSPDTIERVADAAFDAARESIEAGLK